MPVQFSAKGSLRGTTRRTLGALLTHFSSYLAQRDHLDQLGLDFIVIPSQQLNLADFNTKNLVVETFVMSTDPEDLHDHMATLTKRFWLFGEGWDSAAWQYAVEIGRDHSKEVVPVVFTEPELQAIATTDADWLALPPVLLRQAEKAYKDRPHVRVILLSEDPLVPSGKTQSSTLSIRSEVFLMDQNMTLMPSPPVDERKRTRHDH